MAYDIRYVSSMSLSPRSTEATDLPTVERRGGGNFGQRKNVFARARVFLKSFFTMHSEYNFSRKDRHFFAFVFVFPLCPFVAFAGVGVVEIGYIKSISWRTCVKSGCCTSVCIMMVI